MSNKQVDEKVIKKRPKVPKMEENYIIITIDYSNEFVFPYAEGMQFIESMKHAELISNHYQNSDELLIHPMRGKQLSFKLLGRETYIEYKGNFLLDPQGIDPPF